MRICLSSILLLFALIGSAQQDSLVWSDEFNGIGLPDPSKWGYDVGAGGWGNNEVQTYTKLYQNAHQEGGVLIIEALKSGNAWTSARLLTSNKYEFKYGRVVFRAKLPVGSGTWPALWMLGENIYSVGWPKCGEIDVMEHVGKDQDVIHCAVHTPSSYGNTVNQAMKRFDSVSTKFHEYQVKWTPEKLEFRVDSVLLYIYNPTVKNPATWPFDKPCFIIMNIAMGGNMGSDPQYETGGKKNGIDPTLTSARMEIDYVRVYQSAPFSIEEHEKGDNNGHGEMNFFPNPTNGQLQITLPAGTSAQGNIYNISGRNVLSFYASDEKTKVDLSALSKGLYCITLQSEGKISTHKLILQ